VIGVESPLDRPRRQREGTPTRCDLEGLEVQIPDGARSYEGFDLGDDFRVEGFFEAPFFDPADPPAPSAASRASHRLSLTSTSSAVSRRRRRHSAICSFVCATALAGMTFVTVLPSTRRVSDQLGP